MQCTGPRSKDHIRYDTIPLHRFVCIAHKIHNICRSIVQHHIKCSLSIGPQSMYHSHIGCIHSMALPQYCMCLLDIFRIVTVPWMLGTFRRHNLYTYLKTWRLEW